MKFSHKKFIGLFFLFKFIFFFSCGQQFSSKIDYTKYLSEDNEAYSLGYFLRTMYILASEEEYLNSKAENYINVYDKSGNIIGTFPLDFLTDLCLQGSGKLFSGHILTLEYSGCLGKTTTLGDLSSFRSCYARCFRIILPEDAPYSYTANMTKVVPFRTIAVDRSLIPLGTRLYLPKWDGFIFPNGNRHDGCFIADDTGGAITGYRIDIHAGEGRTFYNWLRKNPKIKDVIKEEVFINPLKCETKKLDPILDLPQEEKEKKINISDPAEKKDIVDTLQNNSARICKGYYLDSEDKEIYMNWYCKDKKFLNCPPEGSLGFICHNVEDIALLSERPFYWKEICLAKAELRKNEAYVKIVPCGDDLQEDDSIQPLSGKEFSGCSYMSSIKIFPIFIFYLFLLFFIFILLLFPVLSRFNF